MIEIWGALWGALKIHGEFQLEYMGIILLLFSYCIMEHTLASQEKDPKIKRSTYNKERYEANKDYILKYRNCKVCKK